VISSSKVGGRGEGDKRIFLDTNTIEDAFGPMWKELQSSIEIEFLGRGITGVALNQKHWAVLLKHKNFFCTIEYGQEGILIQYYKSELGIKYACAGIMGDNCTVYTTMIHT
jgi:hypothetical protein